jgi:FkbM family methyltransferase
MFFVGDLDRKISWVVDNCVEQGDVVCDVGANLGLVSLRLAARVGASGRVHSFEPNPRMQYYLRETIAANEHAPIALHPIGLGDRDCKLTLSIPTGNYGAASFKADEFSSVDDLISVPVRRLSQYAAEFGIENIAFMKIDVEGFESEVIAGGADLIARSNLRAIVIEEHAPLREGSLPPALHALTELGFEVFGLPKSLFAVKLMRLHELVGSADCHDYLAISLAGADGLRRRLSLS